MRKQKCAFFGNFEKVFVTHSFLAHIECARTRTLSLFIKQNHNTRNIKPNMGAKNFGKKKDSAKVKRAKRREKKLKALRFAGINVDVKEKDENGETTMMTTENDETEVPTTLSKKEKRARDMRRKKELKLAMISMKEKRRKEEKKTSGTLRKTLSKNIQKMKKERDELVSKEKNKEKKTVDESEFGGFGISGVGEMNDVEMTTT